MGRKRTLEEIESVAKSFHPNFNVIGETYRKNRRFVKIQCSDCGQVFARQPNIVDLAHDCPYCSGFYVIRGKTDIATTDTWMISLIKDKSITYKYSSKVDIKTTFVCPYCGAEKDVIIKDVKRYGFHCNVCSDKLSKPNKFLRALLPQLNVDNIIYEYRSDWTNGKYYDGYFEANNTKYVIEMDGEQHKHGNGFSTKEEQIANDILKNRLAKNKGVHIIRIDTPTYLYDYWIEQFNSCEISNLIAEANIDWGKCIEYAETNILKDMCDFYENNKDATRMTVAEKYKISPHTATNYLLIGSKLGWCHYSAEESKVRSDRFNAKNNGVKNRILDCDGNVVQECITMVECAKYLSTLCDTNISYNRIRYYFKNGINKFQIQNYIVEKVS